MNVVDSSGWLDYFADGPNAAFFAPAVENAAALIVPVISLYEVFQRVHQQLGEGRALEAVAIMMQGLVVDLDASLALNAARLALEWKLPMADSIILATAQAHTATLWTQDSDFKGVPDVRYHPKS